MISSLTNAGVIKGLEEIKRLVEGDSPKEVIVGRIIEAIEMLKK